MDSGERRSGLLLRNRFLFVALDVLGRALSHGLAEDSAKVGRIVIAAKHARLLYAAQAAEQQVPCPRHAEPCAVFARRLVKHAAEQPPKVGFRKLTKLRELFQRKIFAEMLIQIHPGRLQFLQMLPRQRVLLLQKQIDQLVKQPKAALPIMGMAYRPVPRKL